MIVLAATILFVVVLSFIEVLLVPIPLAFLFLFLWSQFVSVNEAFVSAFFAGFLFDILLLRPLGTAPLLLLALLFVGFLYKRKFQTDNLVFVTVFAFVSFLVLEFTYRGVVDVLSALIYTAITLILARILFQQKIPYESWYRVS